MKLLLLLTVFWTMQVLANVAFKWGSGGGGTRTRRWWLGFVAGNAVGASSIWFLMQVYALLPDNSNVAAVLAGGGGFIGSQLLLAWLFRSRLTPRQWCGIALVAVGTAMATLGSPSTTQSTSLEALAEPLQEPGYRVQAVRLQGKSQPEPRTLSLHKPEAMQAPRQKKGRNP